MNMKMNTNTSLKTIRAAMRHAVTQGFDPRNSHDVQARLCERRWKMEAGARKQRERQERSEAMANRWLEQELHRNGHTRWKQAG